jgi:hypothetical protein
MMAGGGRLTLSLTSPQIVVLYLQLSNIRQSPYRRVNMYVPIEAINLRNSFLECPS